MYVGIAILTISLPGPGVILTINNSIQRGFSKSIAGIFGISLGMFIVASISATSLGVVLSNSENLFATIKFVGAMYLIYLGIKIWNAKSIRSGEVDLIQTSSYQCFLEGFTLSILNPKALIFFMTRLIPSFIKACSASE